MYSRFITKIEKQTGLIFFNIVGGGFSYGPPRFSIPGNPFAFKKKKKKKPPGTLI